MMLEPVAKASGRVTKPNSALDQRTISSARRDRCIMQVAAAARNSTTKSRSETASTLFSLTRAKPSSRATAARSMG